MRIMERYESVKGAILIKGEAEVGPIELDYTCNRQVWEHFPAFLSKYLVTIELAWCIFIYISF